MLKKISLFLLSGLILLTILAGNYLFYKTQIKISSMPTEATRLLGDSEGDFYTSDNARIHYWYYNRGSQIVTVFLHGGPGGSTSDLRVIGQAKSYADTFGSLLVFDQRGGGQSEKSADLAESLTYPRMIEDINELRAYVIPGQDIVIFGRSFGGPLAARYANSNPAGVLGYILVSPGPFAANGDILESQRLALTLSVGEDEINRIVLEDRAVILQLAAVRGVRDPESIPIPAGEDDGLDFGMAFAKYGGYFTQDEYPALAALNNVPTLIVYGSYDTQVPPLSVEAMKPYLPNATFLELPGGHGAAYAHEKEFFTAIQTLFDKINEQ